MNTGENLVAAASRLSVTAEEKSEYMEALLGSSSRAANKAPTSMVVGDKRLWDITEHFRDFASELPIGILVKDEQFTLFESVGALEIMDPKMDSGFLAPGETLVDDYDIFRELLPEEVIGIMDQLLCCEMAWHEGYPLSQTLFTSHYIDKMLTYDSKRIEDIQFVRDPQERKGGDLVHTVLRAYCIGLIKCCDYALDEINRSLDGGGTRVNFYEEEDFSGHTYGRDLFTSIPKVQIISELYRAAELVDNMSMRESQSSEINPIWHALRARLDFRITLLIAMATDEPTSTLAEGWKDVVHHLPVQVKTRHLGKLVSESFSDKIQRRLASTVPPKPMVEMSYEDAFEKLTQMCADCQEAVRVIEFGPEHVQRLKAFLWSFSCRKPEPLAYARACLSAPLFSCDERGFEQLLRRDLEEILLPQDPILDPVNWTFESPQSARALPDPRYELANTVDRFTETSVRMVGGYIDLYRAICSNRCRLRRNLCHVVLAFEDHQTRETERLDEILNSLSPTSPSFPLSTWTYYQKLNTMTTIVQLGFELDVYLPDELAGMYWYLGILSISSSSIINLILPILRKSHAKLSKSSKPLHQNQAIEVQNTTSYLESTLHFQQGTKLLADSLFLLYTYLSYLHLIPDPAIKSPFYTPKERYELRMKPFLSVTTATVPPFEEYWESVRPWGPIDNPQADWDLGKLELLDGLDGCVKEARGHFAEVKKLGSKAAMCEGVEAWWGKNISSMLASCVATGIAVSSIKTALEKGNGKGKGRLKNLNVVLPEPGKRYHDWWIIPKVN